MLAHVWIAVALACLPDHSKCMFVAEFDAPFKDEAQCHVYLNEQMDGLRKSGIAVEGNCVRITVPKKGVGV